MAEDTATNKFGREVLKWAWENRDEVLKRIGQVRSWFMKEKRVESDREASDSSNARPGILILGPGGVGKTTIAKMLSGDFDGVLNEPAGIYRESLVVERFNLKDEEDIGIVVAPGQEHRRSGTWNDLQLEISAEKYRGIIIMNSFGYHTFGIGYKDHRVHQGLEKPRTKPRFLAAYLQDRRGDELKVLRTLAPYIQSCRSKLWVLTLVTKEDLWWNQRDSVLGHYQNQSYEAEIVKALGQFDPRHRRHETAFVSLIISNFRDGRGELLSQNVSGYDHELQIHSIRKIFEVIYSLMKWELE